MYTAFAQVYDLLMADTDYQSWAGHYISLLRMGTHGSGEHCTECACGTGSLTIPLQLKGLKMTGIDLSGEMLEIAMSKARKAGLSIPFIRQDMCRITLPTAQDAIFCTCDGVNYLNRDSLQAFFLQVYRQLKPGGTFIFDLSTPFKLKHILGNNTITRSEEHYAYIWENHWSEKNSSVRMSLDIFVGSQQNAYARVEEYQVQYAHTQETIRQLLQASGFRDSRFFSEMTLDPAVDSDSRWHILAFKPQSGENLC